MDQIDNNQIFLILAFFIALMWGLGPIRHKYYLNHISPITLICIVTIVYFIAILPLLLCYKDHIYNDISKCNKILLIEIIFIMLLTSFIPYLINLWMLQKKSAYIVTAITFCAPIFTVFAAIFILKENVSIISILGILFIVIGALCIGYSIK